MNFLSEILLKDPDYAALLKEIEKKRLPTVCTGLSQIHKAALLKSVSVHTGQKITVVTQDEASAAELTEDAKALGLNAVNFPLRDYCIGDFSGYSKEYEHKRTDTLSKLLDGDFELLCVSVDAACQLTVPPEVLSNARFTLRTGETYEISELTERLLNAGYTRSELCEGRGQFSLRGGIFDVFPVNSEFPYRIEFWGDEIDCISLFDPESQRR
ncbi:MAG: transcription-repair coupling factor, partial [Acutalibacteraceae bacterium]|nr:transcription-repair coupling factor [Acutalibacteraceae bacterium]